MIIQGKSLLLEVMLVEIIDLESRKMTNETVHLKTIEYMLINSVYPHTWTMLLPIYSHLLKYAFDSYPHSQIYQTMLSYFSQVISRPSCGCGMTTDDYAGSCRARMTLQTNVSLSGKASSSLIGYVDLLQ